MLWITLSRSFAPGRGAKSVKSQLMESVSVSKALRLVDMNRGDGSAPGSSTGQSFDSVDKCPTDDLSGKSIASDLDGTLLLSRSSFPYFMLVALEAGSPLRALMLLLLSPIAWVLYNLISEELGVKFLIYISCAGLKRSALESVSRGVLPKFYLEDMHPTSFKILTSCEKRVIVTANPRIMVEPFLRDYLDVDAVLGTELRFSTGGYCTGFTTSAGVLVGRAKERAVKKYFGDEQPDVGLGDRETDFDFMSLCKKAYVVVQDTRLTPVPKDQYLKPIIFHDGRLVCRPTPFTSLVVFLWAPIGLILAITRMSIGISLPMWWSLPIQACLGVTVKIRGVPPAAVGDKQTKKGVLFVCSHRTLLDPIFLSIAVRRSVTAVTYSISRFSEVLSPIKTMGLTRCREQDSATMAQLLEEGDLVICPEGTTCREPFLLRFSALFAELADEIIPVSMKCHYTIFHGTSARGWKGLDPFFFFMNPSPKYEVTFLPQLPHELTCGGGKSSQEVANYIQRMLANSLGFQCTNYTRKDKYRILAGNDGIVPEKNTHLKRVKTVGPVGGG